MSLQVYSSYEADNAFWVWSLSVALYLLQDSAGRSDSVYPAGLCLVAGAEFRVSLMTETEQDPQLNV